MAKKVTVLTCQDSIYDLEAALNANPNGIDYVTDLTTPNKLLNVKSGDPIDVIVKHGHKFIFVYHMVVIVGDHKGRTIPDQQFWKNQSDYSRTMNHTFVTIQ